MTTVEKTNASFHIIYDHDRKIMEDYQVKWQMSSFMHIIYRIGGININEASGKDDRVLPVPATYIIGRDGTIAGSFFDEDHTRRMWVSDMIKVLFYNSIVTLLPAYTSLGRSTRIIVLFSSRLGKVL